MEDSKILDVDVTKHPKFKNQLKKEKQGEPKKLSLGEAYKKIENTIDNFANQFMEFLPNTNGVELERLLILDKILGLKETSKILVDNIVIAQTKGKESK